MDAAKLESRFQRQRELEDNSLARGAIRFKERLVQAQQKGNAAQIGAGRKLLVEAIGPLEQNIKVMLDEASRPGRRGRKHFAVKWCQELGADVAAYMTAKVILDRLHMEPFVRLIAMDLCDLMCDELRYRRFKEMAPAFFDYKIKSFNTSSYAHMARSMDTVMKTAKCSHCFRAGLEECPHVGSSADDMPQSQRLLVGTKMIDLFILSTGLCTVESYREVTGRKVRQNLVLVPTEETRVWVEMRNTALEEHWPISMPMIVPPLPWQPDQRGGYRYAMRGKHRLIRRASKTHLEQAKRAEMSTVYTALNRIQETAWKINPHVFSLLQQILERGGDMAGVPETEDRLDVPKPHDIATNADARKTWRKEQSEVKEFNHSRKCKAREVLNVLSTAQAVKDEEAIWFPCNLDFRGRVYPIPNYLSPQGDDLSKSLLTFAQARPLGEDGATWLALHGASKLDMTPDGVKMAKCTLQERIDWIVAHTNEIEQVAVDPFVHRWWLEAEKPLQFYAFCVEWYGYVQAARTGQGEAYLCSLPCAMDGTCNGLQHFAALLRDSEGAAAVNVSPAERPQDIYQRIADAVLEKLEKDAVSERMARLWLTSELVNRKLCKRPTMTFGYGSKQFGFKGQLRQYLRDHKAWPSIKKHFTDQETGRNLVGTACAYMAKLIWLSLAEYVKGAFKGMEWMQQTARLIAGNGQVVQWRVVATGFPVRQEYMKLAKRSINTVLAGKIIQPAVYDVLDTPNPHKQANAVSPNFVHSLDAAALMLTVQAAAGEGVESFGMVHDSYATIPSDCGQLARCTREAFYGLYTKNPVLANFAEQVKPLCKDYTLLPVMPARGTLDLGGVLGSEYFFS